MTKMSKNLIVEEKKNQKGLLMHETWRREREKKESNSCTKKESNLSTHTSFFDEEDDEKKKKILKRYKRRDDDEPTLALKLALWQTRTISTPTTKRSESESRFFFAPDSETRERDFVSLGTTSSGDNNRPNWMRENHADLPILEKGEMDHSWREDGVRDATETSERANRCDASVRGDFCF